MAPIVNIAGKIVYYEGLILRNFVKNGIQKMIAVKHNYFTEDSYYNKPLFETKNFKVIPSLGSLVEGWLMIVPKQFYISFGAIQDSHTYAELNLLIDELKQSLKKIYGEVVLFEHGPVSQKSLVGCSVDYAHLHLVPIQIDLIEKSKEYLSKEIIWEQADGIEISTKYFLANKPYLLVGNLDNTFFIGTSDDIPSQLFRKTIANHLGVEEMYDWRKFEFKENINKTISAFVTNAEPLSVM